MFKTAMAVAAVVVLAQAGAAWAQDALGDGRALDANPQVGSGGYNQPSRSGGPIDPNRVITGNVTGGQFFRGNVPYRGVGEFTDVSGDDDLFRFRAVTQPGSVPSITSRTFGERLAPTPYFRSISGATAGDARGPAGLLRAYSAQEQLFDTGIITAAPGQAVRTPTVGTLGFVEQDGQWMQVVATPLFGVTHRPVEPMLPTTLPRMPDYQDIDLDVEPTAPEDTLAPSRALAPTRVQTTPWSAEPEEEPDAMAEMLGFTPTVPARGMELGLQLQPWQDRLTPEAQQAQLRDHVQKIESSIFSPLDRLNMLPGDDIYLDLLRMLREGTTEETQPPQRIELDSPSEQQLREAAAQRQQALDRMLRGVREPEEEEAPMRPVPEPVQELVDRLNRELPPVGTLAGRREDLANQYMRDAEIALQDGRYFDAERRYERVLQIKPNYPLARVGLTHAQLGAGLVRSAALNLRNTFAAHPELIGVRYEANLLPASQRLQWVRGELDDLIQRGEHQYPTLLLAYVGYQTGNPELVRYGLDMAQARDPADPLIPLLRSIWLDETESAQPAAEQEPVNDK